MDYLADRSSSELTGISSEPEIINDLNSIKLLYKKKIPISELKNIYKNSEMNL